MLVDGVTLDVAPLAAKASYKAKAYQALRDAIVRMNIYGHSRPIRIDERQLCEALGISRTPVREAIALLEQEGLVRSMPRRGVFVVRKTRDEIRELIVVWAALEGMAARLAAAQATPAQIEDLQAMIAGQAAEAESSDRFAAANIDFHQALIRLGGCGLITEMTETLFLHIRAIRWSLIGRPERAERSVADHAAIVAALARRDGDLAETLVRNHALDLSRSVERHGTGFE